MAAPCLQVPEEANSPASFASLKFSPNGKILVGVVGGKIYQLDAYHGHLQQRHSSGIHEGMRPLEACFSPDNNFLLSGEPPSPLICAHCMDFLLAGLSDTLRHTYLLHVWVKHHVHKDVNILLIWIGQQ